MDQTSFLTLSPAQCGEIGAVVLNCRKPRTTEVQALRQREMGERESLAILLDRIATFPQDYPEIQDRPARCLQGIVKLKWIGKRLGCTPKDVEILIARAEYALAQID